MINLFEYIKENKELNTLLIHECDIYFYKQRKETDFLAMMKYIPCHVRHLQRMAAVESLFFLNDGSIYV